MQNRNDGGEKKKYENFIKIISISSSPRRDCVLHEYSLFSLVRSNRLIHLEKKQCKRQVLFVHRVSYGVRHKRGHRHMHIHSEFVSSSRDSHRHPYKAKGTHTPILCNAFSGGMRVRCCSVVRTVYFLLSIFSFFLFIF